MFHTISSCLPYPKIVAALSLFTVLTTVGKYFILK